MYVPIHSLKRTGSNEYLMITVVDSNYCNFV